VVWLYGREACPESYRVLIVKVIAYDKYENRVSDQYVREVRDGGDGKIGGCGKFSHPLTQKPMASGMMSIIPL